MFNLSIPSSFVLLLVPQLLLLITLYMPYTLPRRALAALILMVFALAGGIVLGNDLSWRSLPLAFFGVYQIANIARVIENRLTLPRLIRQVTRSGVVFIILTTASLSLRLIPQDILHVVTSVYPLTTVFLAVIALVVTISSVKKGWVAKNGSHYSDDELPTISVLIPARNEDSELSDCIYSVIKNNYPKLEVIVLDDCSQDNSSDIIKRFAHDGVRFIQGDPPQEKWLAKNQAYETLAAAASGDWLVFMGVDVRLDETVIRTLLTRALNNNKKMISVLPRRSDGNLAVNLLMPLRYWWELAIPRNLVGRPSVLSTFWMIEKKTYKSIGGFKAFAQTVIPESYFARDTYAKGQYDFVLSSRNLRLTSSKTLKDQYDTAVRTRYPQIHRHLDLAALGSCAILLLWIGPFIGSVYALLTHDYSLLRVFAVSVACLIAAHVIIVLNSNPKAVILSLFNLPYLFVQELILITLSAYKYEFSEVVWKGRNICYPVMHVTPRLPSVDDITTTV